MENYYWAHKSSGEVFAVQVENDEVGSACGPLYYKEVTATNLDTWNFNNQPETAAWLNFYQEDFNLLEAPYKGDIL
jgi:hypothetical protein